MMPVMQAMMLTGCDRCDMRQVSVNSVQGGDGEWEWGQKEPNLNLKDRAWRQHASHMYASLDRP